VGSGFVEEGGDVVNGVGDGVVVMGFGKMTVGAAFWPSLEGKIWRRIWEGVLEVREFMRSDLEGD
jgi:hypothetical protein